MSSHLQVQDQLERIDNLIGNIISKSRSVPMEGEVELNAQLKECLNYRVKLVRITVRLKKLSEEVERAVHRFHNPPCPIPEAVKRAAATRSRSVDETEDDDSEDTDELETQYFVRMAKKNRQMMRSMNME